MRILFGPAHDALHVDPAAPGVYEWWYFDALSDDNRFALVAIFFLGTPMSPYYKAVATGKTPNARDWCGVFVSVHERVAHECWRERAYAYNVYRGGAFSPAPRPDVQVGGSRLAGAETAQGCWRWDVNVDEPGLWTGRTQMALAFTAPGADALDAITLLGHAADAAAHTWVCVAPVCRAEGTLALPSGKSIAFRGSGYHDHNFGRLPFDDTDLWYWGRAPLACDDGQKRTAVFYHLQPPASLAPPLSTLLVFPDEEAAGPSLVATTSVSFAPRQPVRSAYGLRHALELGFTPWDAPGPAQLVASLHPERGAYSEGPFYRRLPLTIRATEQRNGRPVWSGKGEGIGEVFRPAGLCGPVASRALWSRLRRRKAARPESGAP